MTYEQLLRVWRRCCDRPLAKTGPALVGAACSYTAAANDTEERGAGALLL